MSAWGAVPFLHRLLGVIQSKNSRALCWAVWGIAFGLSAAAATKSNMLFGKVLGWGFVLPALLQIVSPGTSSACPSSYPGRRRRKKGIRWGGCQADLDSEPHTCEGHMHKPWAQVCGGSHVSEPAHMHTPHQRSQNSQLICSKYTGNWGKSGVCLR